MSALWTEGLMNEGGRLAAVLGPTNTGKTHYAIERMTAYASGMIGFPLRLLAREVYDRVVQLKGANAVALITGEEKIIPATAKYFLCTVEAMPVSRDVEFLAIDEIQLAADPDRGHVFTRALLHARGRHETLFLGADTMRPILRSMFPGIEFVSRSRLSQLSYGGPKKLSRLPRRSAVVAFSAEGVYSIAELMRRQRGGAAVVMGALSPRTRNAQVELYQSGEVDFLVATDAIGMGLNLDVDHVAFAGSHKYDGRRHRELTPAETAQIAGRAGRHMNDGSFGVTGDCPPFDEELIEKIETHEFDAVRGLYWRNDVLDFANPSALLRSLDERPPRPQLRRGADADDVYALKRLLAMEEVSRLAKGGAALKRLWEVCQIPDFRKTTHDAHARLVADIYLRLMGDAGALEEDWVEAQIRPLDRVDGDVDSLANRIAHIRTWTFVTNRSQWVKNALTWQGRARAIEDRLSDALHEKLTQRFIDRRTSVLMRKLKDDAPLLAGVASDGEVVVEGEFVGRLLGFQFMADPRASGVHGKAVRAAALKALKPEIAARAAALARAEDKELELQPDGVIRWRQSPIARLKKGPMPLRPDVDMIGDDMLSVNARPRVIERVNKFVADKIEFTLSPLLTLQKAVNQVGGEEAVDGLARGLAFRILEQFGALSRADVAEDVRTLDQDERGKLRKVGVRFGEYSVYMPPLLKPAPARMLVLLWALSQDKNPADYAPPPAGHVSVVNDKDRPKAFYYAAGFRPSGARAVRIDMLERLANLIREAKQGVDMREGFEATPQMMSLVGCSGEDFEDILKSLGLQKNTVKRAPKPPQEAAKAEEAKAEAAKEASAETDDTDITDPLFVEAAAMADAIGLGAPAAAAAEEAPVETPQTDEKPAEAATETSSAPETPEVATEESENQEAEAKTEAAPAEAEAASTDAEGETSAEPTAAPDPAEEIEVTLWRNAPRKPKRDARPRRKGAEGDKQGQGQKQHQGKPYGKAGKRKGQRQDGGKPGGGHRPHQHRPRKEKPMDPDSPFAVLAALKGGMTDEKKSDKADDKPAPEKTS